MKSYNFHNPGKQQRITKEIQYQAKRSVHDLTRKLILESAQNGLSMSFSEHIRLWFAVAAVIVAYVAITVTAIL